MKYFLILLVLLLFSFSSNSQLRYSDLDDLNTIAKKEDFNALKTFLLSKRYTIEEFQTNYDHGSYYVIVHLKAQKPIGFFGNRFSLNDDEGDIFDKIEISLDEYDDYKKLTVSQYIFTDKEYNLNFIKFAPLSFWLRDAWTTVSISTDYGGKQDFIGKKAYNYLNFEEPTLEQIPSDPLREYFKKKNLSDKSPYFFIRLLNNNPLIGELKHEQLTFQRTGLGNLFRLSIETKIIKGKNISASQDNKVLHIPLRKHGKTYLITIKFGKLTKTYVLDSGASDMSIDEETVNYFENSNQLKIENRLTNAKYQLADGSVVELKRVRVPSFLINDILIKNVDATIVQNGKPLLLGKSFLDSFKSWKIDNETQTLVIELF